ncbi:NAD(P)/FAD-dependent oxidoreductase [Poseidonocella sp. HB161398]|uniref:NAD(P)/FAD-dependent oxidoreductase n=1 Tax=Poseidonocella sp. HB161398 TaxID=2320855 RepID=UPI001108FDC2|nr:FAD/NAD(P)-binding oxidoreductase [Poseidonocella sp. HB161398]
MSGQIWDVAIIGGGPAGLGAAAELRRLGVARVVVLERFETAGGIPRHCGHPPFGLREFRRVLTGPAYAARLVEAAEAAGAEIRTRTSVTAIRPGGILELATTDGPQELRARRILLATGNRETTRAQSLVPGMRPVGVMNTAALQSFLYEEGRAPFARPVVIGSELVALSALLSCRRHGIRPAAMVETRPRVQTRRAFGLLPRLFGVPLHCGAEILGIEGRGRVSGVRLRLADGTEHRIGCDGVIFSGRFTPEAALARASGLALDAGTQGPRIDAEGRSSDPLVFVAGNVLHPVETAGYCWDEGRRMARRIAADLAGSLAAEAPRPALAPGPGLRYVVPQALVPGRAVTLNLRAEGRVRGRLVLAGPEGREYAAASVNAAPETPLRLDVPALADLPAELHLRLDREG